MKDPIERQAAIQPEQQHGRVFKGVVVEYPPYNIWKPYFSIKYTENGQEFIGYGTYKPEVLSEYLKEYFMPPAQPDVPDTNVGDCISKQAVVKFFNDWISCLDENCHHQSVADMIIIKNDFKNLPSAQPERKKGKWIRHDEIKNVYGGICIECSECGEKYVVQHILDEKYCRNCGADMRGEQDG